MISIYFDGGCRPNPGTGYGSWEIQNKSAVCTSVQTGSWLSRIGETWTNNQAEYESLRRCLEQFLLRTKPVTVQVNIYSDSRLLVEQLSGRWKIKDFKIKLLADQVKEQLKHINSWRIEWNPRSVNVEKFGH